MLARMQIFKGDRMSPKIWKMIAPVAVILVFWFMPTPEGLTPNAWKFFAIFMGVVVGLVLEPIPAALVGFTGISLVAVLGLIDPKSSENIKWALSGFSNTVIWLIFAAFMFALGYKKTGLGRRISLVLVKYLGKSSLGLGYAVAFADLILAPFMPSNTARSAGTIYPVASNIPPIFNSTPDNEPRKLGAYLTWVALASTCVTSSMFLTALAPNLLAVDLIAKGTGNAVITWGQWASIMIPLMLPLFLLVPLITYVIYPPTQKTSPEAPAWAAAELKTLGGVKGKEILMGVLAVVALVLWIFGKEVGIHGTTAAIAIVAVMVLTNVITWDDVLSNKEAFNILIWFATLVAMASGLSKTGVLKWMGTGLEGYLVGMTPTVLMLSMLLIFFVLHYFFASVTAHTTALLPLFMAIAVQMIAPEQLVPFSILMAGTLGIMGILTPYATGPSPIWFGSRFIPTGTFWLLGGVFGALYIAVLLVGVFIFV